MKKNKVLIIVCSSLLIVAILFVAMFKLNVLDKVFNLKASITLSGLCNSGYTFNKSTNKCEKTYEPTNCPSGYSGSNCSKSYDATYSTTANCPGNGSLVAGTDNLCEYQAENKTENNYCSSGKYYESYGKCMQSAPSCPYGYEKNLTNTACVSEPTCKYKQCGSNGELCYISNGMCRSLSNSSISYGSASCPSGTNATIVGNVCKINISCPPGWEISESYCSKNPETRTVKKCSYGGNFYGTASCRVRVTPITGYTCPNGGTLSGDKCVVTTSARECNSGDSKKNGICLNSVEPNSYTRINIDHPGNENDVIESNTESIEGWVLSTVKDKRIEVYIDSTKLNGVTTFARDDIFEDNDVKTGKWGTKTENPKPAFKVTDFLKNNSGIKDGTHTLKVKVINSSNNEVLAETNETFLIEPQAMFDDWSGMVFTTSGETINFNDEGYIYHSFYYYDYNVGYSYECSSSGLGQSIGGIVNEKCTSKSTFKTYNESLPSYSREKYQFLGWSTNKNATKAQFAPNYKVTKAFISTYAGKTLYAIWAPLNVKISFNTNGGSVINTGKGFTETNGKIYRNGELHYQSIPEGSTADLINYNNSSYLNIEKPGYVAKQNAEWIDKETGKTYSQSVSYSTDDFCDKLYFIDCTVQLSVNWVKKEVDTSSLKIIKDKYVSLERNSNNNTLYSLLGKNIEITNSFDAKINNPKLKTTDKLKVNNKSYTITIRGDANADGEVNMSDVKSIYKKKKGEAYLEEPQEVAADTNEDDKIDLSDIINTYKIHNSN